jgi:DNA polymerase-3 subunit alpha (Gram-positive type)
MTNTLTYIAIDLETTGLNPKLNKIIEIGAIKIINGKEAGEFQTFVNPYQQLPEEITKLTGITDEDLENAPGIETVIREFLEFAGDLPLVGHQVIFDYSFLKKAAVNQRLSFEREGIDTLKLARKFMPAEEKKNLRAACEYFGIVPIESHRALADAKAANQLLLELEKHYGTENPRAFLPEKLNYKVKKEQPASKRQKEHLQDLLKYHRISLTVQIDHLSKNEISRITDKIIGQYGRI